MACWSYCLTPNHAHLVLTPSDETGLALAVGEAHRRYAVFVSARAGWTGHLFQGRFASVAMDEDHLLAALRYIALNPVKARLTKRPQDRPWSSAPALLAGRSTPYVDVAPALARIGDPAAFLSGEDDAEALWRHLLGGSDSQQGGPLRHRHVPAAWSSGPRSCLLIDNRLENVLEWRGRGGMAWHLQGGASLAAHLSQLVSGERLA
jgi:putative transposase